MTYDIYTIVIASDDYDIFNTSLIFKSEVLPRKGEYITYTDTINSRKLDFKVVSVTHHISRYVDSDIQGYSEITSQIGISLELEHVS